MADPQLLMQQLQAFIKNPDAVNANEQQRSQILKLPLPLAAAFIVQEHGILQYIADNKGSAVTVDDIAKATNLSLRDAESLVEYLSVESFIQETSRGRYGPSKLTYLFLDKLFKEGICHFHDSITPSIFALNERLHTPLSEDRRTAFEMETHGNSPFYEWLDTNPMQQKAFNDWMISQFASLPSWLDAVDLESDFAQNIDSTTKLFVDVGGGNGQQCMELITRYPNLEGEIVLQDRAPVLAKAVVPDRVKSMDHDFLTEQLVKGARVYYFRQIFHNNDDETCVKLRAHLPAMAASSVILINEKVLPDDTPGDVSEYALGLSIVMLAMFNAIERKESQWRKLIDDASFEIKLMKRFTDFGDNVIVVVPKDEHSSKL